MCHWNLTHTTCTANTVVWCVTETSRTSCGKQIKSFDVSLKPHERPVKFKYSRLVCRWNLTHTVWNANTVVWCVTETSRTSCGKQIRSFWCVAETSRTSCGKQIRSFDVSLKPHARPEEFKYSRLMCRWNLTHVLRNSNTVVWYVAETYHAPCRMQIRSLDVLFKQYASPVFCKCRYCSLPTADSRHPIWYRSWCCWSHIPGWLK
jgi:hypothetical protein